MTRAGAELQLCRLAEDQVAAGNDITVGCFSIQPPLRSRLEDAGVCVVSSQDGRVDMARELRRAAASSDVLHAWMYHGFLMSMTLRPFARCSHIWSIRRTAPSSVGLRRRTRAIVRLTARASNRWADGLIYCSHAAASAHRNAGFRARHETVIYNSVEAPAGVAAQPSSGAARRVGFLGRFNHDKGVDILLAAWGDVARSHPGAELVVAGPSLDETNAELEEMIRALDLPRRPSLIGSVADPIGFLRSLDCLVSPSRTEGFPNVIAEALSIGLPVVATDVGGSPEVVGNIGELVPPESPQALGAAISAFLDDPTTLRERATRGPAHIATQFDRAMTMTKTDEFYDIVVKG